MRVRVFVQGRVPVAVVRIPVPRDVDLEAGEPELVEAARDLGVHRLGVVRVDVAIPEEPIRAGAGELRHPVVHRLEADPGPEHQSRDHVPFDADRIHQSDDRVDIVRPVDATCRADVRMDVDRTDAQATPGKRELGQRLVAAGTAPFGTGHTGATSNPRTGHRTSPTSRRIVSPRIASLIWSRTSAYWT